MTRILLLPVLVSLLFVAGCKRVVADAPRAAFQPVQISAPDVDAGEPVTVGAPDGGFYVAWVNHDAENKADVMLARFNNEGAGNGAAVRVNRQSGVATAWRGDQPSLAVSGDAVYVLWTARVESDGKKGTDLYLSTSNDRGQSFLSEVKVNDDKGITSHGMHSLAVAKDGRIYVAWLDERNVRPTEPSQHAGHHMEANSELFTAYSSDGGKTFSANQKVASDTCPCCKTALAIAPDGTLYAGWRQVLPGNFRHIAVASSSPVGQTFQSVPRQIGSSLVRQTGKSVPRKDSGVSFSAPVIVSDDKWMLHGCPVSGPSLAVDAMGNLKVVWYSAGEGAAPGLYFAESHDRGRSFSPRSLLSPETVKGSPAIAAEQNRTVAIWQGSGAQQIETRMRELGGAGSAISIASNAELPSAVLFKDRLFVAYITSVNQKRSVWLASSSLLSH